MNKNVPMMELSPLIEEALQNGGEIILNVTGSSMQPLLYEHRDRVCIVKPKQELFKRNVVLFYKNSKNIYKLHRLMAIKKSGFIMAGDHQWVKEYEIAPSQVLGVMKGFWRKGKYISCDDFGYCLYSRIWVYCFPIRKIFFRSIAFLRHHLHGDRRNEG